jgi:hypothetical protein
MLNLQQIKNLKISLFFGINTTHQSTEATLRCIVSLFIRITKPNCRFSKQSKGHTMSGPIQPVTISTSTIIAISTMIGMEAVRFQELPQRRQRDLKIRIQ